MDSTVLSSIDDFEVLLTSNDTIIDLLQMPVNELEQKAVKFLGIEILTNSTNLFSATFLFAAFMVLFRITIKSDNKTWQINNQIPLSIAIAITVLNIAIIIVGYEDMDFKLQDSSTLIRLLGGLYNGIAMTLLFSRFISMEYYFQSMKKGFEKPFYYYGTIIALPLYIVVQPLYALFNVIELQAASIFKASVFLICFWGKLVFLFFVYTMLQKKWMHSYILLTLLHGNHLNQMSIDLDDVDKYDGDDT